jgi:hypothetical protein
MSLKGVCGEAPSRVMTYLDGLHFEVVLKLD